MSTGTSVSVLDAAGSVLREPTTVTRSKLLASYAKTKMVPNRLSAASATGSRRGAAMRTPGGYVMAAEFAPRCTGRKAGVVACRQV